MGLRPTHGNESQALVTPAQAGVHLDSRFRGSDVTFERAKRGISLCSGNNARFLAALGMTRLFHGFWVPVSGRACATALQMPVIPSEARNLALVRKQCEIPRCARNDTPVDRVALPRSRECTMNETPLLDAKPGAG